MSPNPSLTTPQQKVLALIACGFTATAAAEQAGVHRNTVANWLRIDEFRSALVRAREEKEILYWDQAEALAAFSIVNLRRLAVDASVPPAVQLKATMALLDYSRAYTPDSCAVVLPEPQTAPEISKTTHNDAQCACAQAHSSQPSALSLSGCRRSPGVIPCQREPNPPYTNNIRRTPCKSLSRNTKTRFKAR